MKLKRRAFLQQSSAVLAALGVSETGLAIMASRYQQALAEPTRRKLALLVGINQYSEQVCDCASNRGSALLGCVTDVKLQRELLIHRFGFQPQDILTLTDQQATRQGIEEAFLAHLTEQARPGDVVVFHFSGLGSRVKLGAAGEAVQNSLVPFDGKLPTEENPAVNDLMEETLGLLLRSLATEQVTTVLDASYLDTGKVLQGNLRIRSRPSAPTGQLSEAELAFQERLLNRVAASREQIKAQWRSGQLPGVLLAAAGANQIATEEQWGGFSAGLFTYALTQQLWWSTPATSLRVSLSRTAGSMRQVTGSRQQPLLRGQKSQDQALTAYFNPVGTTAADGVITATEEDGKTFQLLLAGLPPAVLEYYGVSSLLAPAGLDWATIAPPKSTAAPEPIAEAGALGSAAGPTRLPLIQVRSRDGLLLRARSYPDTAGANLQVGQRVQEAVRLLPRNISLTVALDSSLERIERVDATSAFSAIPRVSAVAVGDQPADYLFGKLQPLSPTLAASLPADGAAIAASSLTDPPAKGKGYGLFYLGRSAIPSTVGQDEEAVKTAVHRIAPQLKTLLAAKLLRLTANQGSSRLGIRATLEAAAPQERMVIQQETPRAPWPSPGSRLASLFEVDGLPKLPINGRIQYRLTNYSDRPIYFILLGLDSSGNAIALYPASAISSSSTDPKLVPSDSMIPAGETLLVPQSASGAEWVVQGPTGLAETHLIFSRAPLTQSFAALETAMRSKGDSRRVNLLQNPLEVVQAVLQDLHQASTANARFEVPTDAYALDVNAWATLSFIYEVTV